jgi:hypothetical protein
MVLMLITPIASADSSWNPIEIGKNMVSDGIVDAFRNLADEIMEFICSSADEEEDDDHDSITTMIINFASWGVKPFTYPSIVSMMGVSFAVGIGILITYFFIGAGTASINGGMGSYGKNAVYGILLMSFAPLLIWIVLLFAKVLKVMLMSSIASSISPSIESCTVLYFMMALMWLLVAIFFGISNIVICLTAGLSFAIGALYASKKTRHVAMWAIDYFVTMVTMQVMVITIAVIVVGFVTDIKSGEYGYMMDPGMEAITYVGMILLILLMCIVMTFGKALVLKTAKTAIRLAVI